MKITWQLFFTVIVTVMGAPLCSYAQVQALKSTKIQVVQVNYSGEKNKSFSEGSPALGLEVSSDYGRSWGRVYAKARGLTSSGSQNFLDGTSTVKCSYTYYQGQFEFGALIAPIPARDTGISVFLSGGALLGYNWLSLDSSTTLTNLRPSEAAVSYGYAAGIGAEWVLKKGQGQRSMLTGEINYRVEQSSLAKQTSFDLSGLSISIGFGW